MGRKELCFTLDVVIVGKLAGGISKPQTLQLACLCTHTQTYSTAHTHKNICLNISAAVLSKLEKRT